MILVYMKSLIDSDNIKYTQSYGIDPDDVNYNTDIYDIVHENIELEIAIGNMKDTYEKYGVIYGSIYMIINDIPISRIGVFEIDKTKILTDNTDSNPTPDHISNILDNIDIEDGNVLIFASVNYINKKIKKTLKEPIVVSREDNTSNPKLDIIELPDDVLVQNIDKSLLTSVTSGALDTLKGGIFIDNSNTVLQSMLLEETENDSMELSNEYKSSSKNTWIEQFTKNHKYTIQENEGGGDCLFAVIRDGFRSIGKETTVKKLRALLAKEVTRKIFDEYTTLYNQFSAEYHSIDTEMTAILKTIKELKRRLGKTIDKIEHTKIVTDANELTARYKKLSETKIITKELLSDFLYMQTIKDFETFQEFITTSKYWADSWAISTLERILNIKLIILNESAYKNEDTDGVMQCGPIHNTEVTKFAPDYYLMTSYDGSHYRGISYMDKSILKFREIPYNIKTLLLNKCLERNSGIYYLIEDMCNYKSKLGLDADYGEPVQDEDDVLNKNLYDSDTVFMFHVKSYALANAGKGQGELIDDSTTIYNLLNTRKPNSEYYNWRRKLDDSWAAPFTVDGHRWQSVKHYVLGSQYKKSYPDFYIQFSLDEESELSTNLEMAILATSKSGEHNDVKLRPDNVTVDADFYSNDKFPRCEEERQKALEAKFTQNLDLQKILKLTGRAKLTQFNRRKEAKVDMLLMKIRHSLT